MTFKVGTTLGFKAMEFSVEDWAKEYEIEPGTIAALVEKGFKSRRSIAKISPDLIKKEFRSLMVAQQLLLAEAVEALQSNPQPQVNGQAQGQGAGQLDPGATSSTSQPPTTQTGDRDEPMNANVVWNLLKQTDIDDGHSRNAGKPLIFDPFVHDPSSAVKTSQYRDIRDFMTIVTKPDEGNKSTDVLSIGTFEFVLNDKRPAYSSVNVSQYMEASMRILREMAVKDNINKTEILDYVNYIVKIATLSQSFSWDSVLKYDLEYRKAQSELGFRWSADNSYLMQLLLKPNNPLSGRNSGSGTHSQKKVNNGGQAKQETFDPKSGRPICRIWNQGHGCTMRFCKYAHVCILCYNPSHPRTQHDISHVTHVTPSTQEPSHSNMAPPVHYIQASGPTHR